MRPVVPLLIVVLLVSGCVSNINRRAPRPVIAEFAVAGVVPGPLKDAAVAERVAGTYFREFDESGSIQMKAERRDRWLFTAHAGDFVAVPVADIVVMKDGSVISQHGFVPTVRLRSGKWLYDRREIRQMLRDLDEDDHSHGKASNQSVEATRGTQP